MNHGLFKEPCHERENVQENRRERDNIKLLNTNNLRELKKRKVAVYILLIKDVTGYRLSKIKTSFHSHPTVCMWEANASCRSHQYKCRKRIVHIKLMNNKIFKLDGFLFKETGCLFILCTCNAVDYRNTRLTMSVNNERKDILPWRSCSHRKKNAKRLQVYTPMGHVDCDHYRVSSAA